MAKQTKKKPSIPSELDFGWFSSRAETDVQRWSTRNQRFEEDQEFAELHAPVANYRSREDYLEQADRPGGTPPGNEPVVLGTPRILLNKTSRLLGRAKKSIEYTGDRPQHQQEAQVIENLLRWIDREWSQRHQMGLHAPLQLEMGHYAALRGWIASRVVLNPDEKDKLPVLRSLHDPANVYPYEVGRRLVRVTEHYTASISDLLEDEAMVDGEEWLSSIDDQSGGIDVYSVYVEYKGKHYHTILGSPAPDHSTRVDDARWLKRPTRIDYMPWVITLVQGSPYRNTDWSTGSDYQTWMGEGVLTTLADNFRYRNKMATMMMTVLASSANPAKVVYSGDERQAAEQFKEGFHSGDTIVLQQGDKFEVVRIGPNPGDFEATQQMLKDVEYQGALHPSLYGDPSGATSGIQSAIIKSNAVDFLYPLQAAMAAHEELVLRKALQLIAEFWPNQMEVFIPAAANRPAEMIEISPEMIEACGFGGIKVEYEDVTPQDFQAATQVWTTLVRERLASRKRARGRSGLKFDDPELEDMEVMSDLITSDEQIVKFMIPFALAMTGNKLGQQLYGQLHGAELMQLMMAAAQNAGLMASDGGMGSGGPAASPTQATAGLPGMMDGQVLPPVMQTGMWPDQSPGPPTPATVMGGMGAGGIPPAGGMSPIGPAPVFPGV